MKIIETQVTEAQWEEISSLVIQEGAYIGMDTHDVQNILVGKAGVMYQGKEDASIGYTTFFQNFSKELLTKEQVKNCRYMLISIGNIETDPMDMTDICAINDFFKELSPEIEAMWSVFKNKAEDGFTITAICTNEV